MMIMNDDHDDERTHAPLGKSCNIISQYLPPAIRIRFPRSLPSSTTSLENESCSFTSSGWCTVDDDDDDDDDDDNKDNIVSNPPVINLISPNAVVMSPNFSDDSHVPHSYRKDSCAFTSPMLLLRAPTSLVGELFVLLSSLLSIPLGVVGEEEEGEVEEVRAMASSNEHAADVALNR